MYCRKCHEIVHQGWAYCPACGAELAEAPAPVQSVVTALFVDLVASTRLARAMYSTEYFRFMRGLLGHLSEEVVSRGGRVVQFQGDAILAVFGPDPDPDEAALRAVQATVACLDGIRSLGAQAQLVLRGRAGLDTDAATLGTLGGEFTVMGNVVNLARRLCSAAKVGEAFLSEATRARVSDRVLVEPATRVEIRDYHDVNGPYRLLRLADRPLGSGVTPFRGRDAELAALSSVMRDVTLGGVPSRVAVIGAAGSGKTRLVAQAADAFPEARLVTISPGRGLAGLARSLLPVRAWDDPEALAQAAAALGVPGSEAGLSAALGSGPAGADPAVALARWLNGMAAERPVFLALDRWSELEPDLMAVVEALEGWRSGALLTMYLGAVTPEGMPVIELGPLETPDAKSLVVALAGRVAEPSLPDILNDAAGLPSLLVAAGRSLALRQGRAGNGPLVTQLAQSLASLTPQARQVLAAGTLLAPEFDLNALAAVVGDAAEPGVELASQRGWIVPIGGFRRAREHVGLATFVFAAPLVEQAAREFRIELPLESLPAPRPVDSLDGTLSWRKLIFEGLLPAADPDLDP